MEPNAHAPKTLREEIQRLRQQGLSQDKVAKALGISRTSVKRYEGEHVPSLRWTHPKATREEAVRRMKAGEKAKQVAHALGLKEGTVFSWNPYKRSSDEIRRQHPPEVKEMALGRIDKGEQSAEVARALRLPLSTVDSWAKQLRTSLSSETCETIRQALAEGKTRSAVATELRIPVRSVKFVADGHNTTPIYSMEQKQEAISEVEAGISVKEVAQKLGCHHSTVWGWHHAAVAAGSAKKAPSFKARINDLEFEWITRISPHLEDWRILCRDWLKCVKAHSDSVYAISTFIERYLVAQNLPVKPVDLFKRGVKLPDFYRVACGGGIKQNNTVHRLLEWVLRTPDFSEESEDGEIVVSPAFRNPIPLIPYSGTSYGRTESDKVPMTYWLIKDLRARISAGPHFCDWTWVQGLLGMATKDGSRAGADWFEVPESRIDRSDPDCVWRRRERIREEPVLEMWSPVRWVALLTKLQTPARTGQIRMSDSGESDTWWCQDGRWILNPGPLKRGTIRKPWCQGILRRPPGNEDAQTILYFNNNKTRDIGKRGSDKGMECPWPHFNDLAENPYYWLQKLRDWQVKYNPIDRQTDWREIPAGRALSGKSEIQKAEYPPTCFLFRTPETPNDSHFPAGNQMLDVAWAAVNEAYEAILTTDRPMHEDGTPILDPESSRRVSITLIDPENGRPVTTLHGIRVSLITHLILDGNMSPEMMMKIVGHARLLMTLYYTKPGLAQMQDALAQAHILLDATKDNALIRDLTSRSAEEMRDTVVFNAEDWTTVLPVNPADRNPLGWLLMHDGICLAGGNTGPLDGNANVPGCHNGGPPLRSPIHGPVEGGSRNCTRCRWKCAGKRHALGLQATYNNRAYHLHKQQEKAVKTERDRNQLLAKKAGNELHGKVFGSMRELKTAERLYEQAMAQLMELARDLVAVEKMMERVKALPDHTDGTEAMALQGDLATLHFVIEDTDSELLALARICEDVEFFPDLDPGVAIYEFAQVLDRAFEREGHPPVLARMNEQEKLMAANAFMRALEQRVNPDNHILARRETVQLLDRKESLEQLLGINLADLLPSAKSASNDAQPVSLRLIHRGEHHE